MQKLIEALPFNGSKTYAGAFAYILSAVLSYADKLAPAQAALASQVSLGVIALGLAHKLAKVIGAKA